MKIKGKEKKLYRIDAGSLRLGPFYVIDRLGGCRGEPLFPGTRYYLISGIKDTVSIDTYPCFVS